MSAMLDGLSLSNRQFRVLESWGPVEPLRVFEVLRGETAAYLVHGFLSPQNSRIIANNFWASGHLAARQGKGEDGIEAYLVGASHIEKTTAEYLEEAAAVAEAVQTLYTGTIDPFAALRDLMTRAGQVATVRAATESHGTAGHSKAVCWNDVGAFLLQPHDDLAQLRDPRQADFEVQRATQVMAVNIYPEVPAGGGQIQIWNLAPDDATRERLGLRYSGFPYPPDLLRGIATRTICVGTGDLCLVNGNLIHAVLSGTPLKPPGSRRLLLTCFMAIIDRDQAIWWT